VAVACDIQSMPRHQEEDAELASSLQRLVRPAYRYAWYLSGGVHHEAELATFAAFSEALNARLDARDEPALLGLLLGLLARRARGWNPQPADPRVRSLLALPEDERELLLLTEIVGLDLAHAARLMKLTPPQANELLTEARRRLLAVSPVTQREMSPVR
jgi:predicted DNA-binding protein (UPF0251 family)